MQAGVLLASWQSAAMSSGVVITGGSTILEGMPELAEQVFNLPVRRGLPINLKGLPEELMKPMYTTAAGLLLQQGACPPQ